MRHLLQLCFISALAFIFIVCAIPFIAAAYPAKVGVILPMTGSAASYGEQFRSGIEMAAGKLPLISFVFEDSKFDNKTALSAFNKLVAIDRIDALISFGGATCEVLNTEAQRRKILHYAAGCNTARFETPESFNFRLDVNETIAAAKTAEYLRKQSVSRVALLYVDNSWAGAIIKTTREAFSSKAVTTVSDISFSEEASMDLRSSLLRLKSSNPELIFLISLPNLTPSVLRQIREVGLSVPIMSNISVENPEVVRLAGGLADGIFYLSVKDSPGSRQQFSEFYKVFPQGNPFAAWGHDSIFMLHSAMTQSSPRDYMSNLRDFAGAFNRYTYDKTGELHLDYEIREIRKGKFVWKANL